MTLIFESLIFIALDFSRVDMNISLLIETYCQNTLIFILYSYLSQYHSLERIENDQKLTLEKLTSTQTQGGSRK